MTQQKRIAAGALAALICIALGALILGHGDEPADQAYTGENDHNLAADPEYAFETAKEEDPDFGGYRNFRVIVRKNGELLKAFPVDNANVGIASYALSPDKRYVAFKASQSEGGCMFADTPRVIDLQGLAFVMLPEASSQPGGASNARTIESIRWIDSANLEVAVRHGIEDNDACGPYTLETQRYEL